MTFSSKKSYSASEFGRAAEEAVAAFLVSKGFQILERNWRVHPMEIDLIAEQGNLLLFVEVRARRASGSFGALASISVKKKRLLLLASSLFLKNFIPLNPQIERIRIDVAGVSLRTEGLHIDYIPGAIIKHEDADAQTKDHVW